MNRRQILSTSTASAAALLSGCQTRSASRAATATQSVVTRPVGANSDIRVAVVGFHAQGRVHIRAYQKMPGVRIVALCDVDEQVLRTQADQLAKDDVNVATYRDIRELLDSNEVDAISCAMPDRFRSMRLERMITELSSSTQWR